MEKIWHLIQLAFNWFIRRKALYRLTGITACSFVFLELGAAIIPVEAKPDFELIGEKDGELLVVQTDGDTKIKVGDNINIGFDASRCHIFDELNQAFILIFK